MGFGYIKNAEKGRQFAIFAMFCSTLERMSRSKRKGTAAESALVDYLGRFFVGIERRALSGSKDRGDIAGIPKIVIEVKNHKSYKIPEWIKETQIETMNDEAHYGFLVIKPNGIGLTKVEDWWAVMPVSTMVELIGKVSDVKKLQP